MLAPAPEVNGGWVFSMNSTRGRMMTGWKPVLLSALRAEQFCPSFSLTCSSTITAAKRCGREILHSGSLRSG